MAAKQTSQSALLPGRVAMWACIVGCLLLPLIAMQLTDEVNWTTFDFITAAALLVGAGLAFEAIVRSNASRKSRMTIAITIAAAVTLLWAQGAVGVF